MTDRKPQTRSSKPRAVGLGTDAAEAFDIPCLEDLDLLLADEDDDAAEQDEKTATASSTVH